MNDPYKTLGVAKSASEAEIKKAFRNLAKKHHPDAHPGDEKAKQRFQEISSAYDVIGDKDKRAKFDAGEIDASGNPRGFDPRAYGQQGGFRGNPFGGGGGDRDFHFSWGQGEEQPGFSAEDIFAEILGGRRPGGGARASRTGRGEDFPVAVTVSFAEAILGGTRRVILQNGEQIDVKIPPGLREGQSIRVKGRGGAGRGGGPSGDVLIQMHVAPHPFITRDGNDLRMDLPVSLKEAVLGGKVPVPALSGTVNLSIPPGSNTGAVLRLKGKGVPATKDQGAGDLYVRLVVTLPDKDDAELKAFAEGWKTQYDPRTRMR
ncbi:MAG TPA: DnaJ C-terminal domain-containing protein [Rhizomicrobium sp.]|jgi:DnaJ-class molecular chaperone|nr:DnaJ C-terminal domain-containing protein [Rhizomicrobium sp.]